MVDGILKRLCTRRLASEGRFDFSDLDEQVEKKLKMDDSEGGYCKRE